MAFPVSILRSAGRAAERSAAVRAADALPAAAAAHQAEDAAAGEAAEGRPDPVQPAADRAAGVAVRLAQVPAVGRATAGRRQPDAVREAGEDLVPEPTRQVAQAEPPSALASFEATR